MLSIKELILSDIFNIVLNFIFTPNFCIIKLKQFGVNCYYNVRRVVWVTTTAKKVFDLTFSNFLFIYF